MRKRKKRGKEHMGAKFMCLQGERLAGGMVVVGSRSLQLRSRLEEGDGTSPLYFHRAVEEGRSNVRTPSDGHPKLSAGARTPRRALR